MTHPTYTQQALCRYNLPRLKRIATELGVAPTGDKRAAQTWVNAIIIHQSTQLQKVDNQALAQAELDNYIATQAQALAPEPLTIVEISFDHHEYYAGNQLIASISYNDNHLTQRWVVMVKGVEKFRANTWAKCHRFIQWHQLDGTLNTPPIPQVQELTFLEISYYDQEVHIGDYHTDSYLVASISFDHDNYEDLYWRVRINRREIYRDITPALCYEYIKQQYQQGTLPVQEQLPEEVCTTGNEIMVQIFTECEKFGFDILDDGIYNGDAEGGKLRKLGKVGQTDGGWWFTRAADETQQRIPCDSALDAVWWLSNQFAITNSQFAVKTIANCELRIVLMNTCNIDPWNN